MTPSHEGNLSAKRLRGTVGTGKTEALIDHVVELLNEGTAATDIGVFCASPHAASAFSLRLAAKAGDTAQGVVVTTPRQAALSMLASEEAQAFTGRRANIMANFEYSFLMEDMKVSGLRPKRLREMLKFFYRSWTELVDDDPDWLMGEEIGIHELLKKNLDFVGSMLEPEVAGFAIRFLRANDEALASRQIAHVLVDDYQCLSKASQVLVNMLAAESITAAGDPCACNEVYDSYPFVQGFDDLADTYPSLDTEELTMCYTAKSVCAATNNLLADSCMPETPSVHSAEEALDGTVQTLAFSSADDEFSGIAEYVDTLINSGMNPSKIHIAVPNKTWSSHVAAALSSRNIAGDPLPLSQILGGDIRDMERSKALRFYTALKLVADPENALAWRCWCGYGDYLTNSAAFDALRTLAEEQGLTLRSALEFASKSPDQNFLGYSKIVAAYAEGKELIEKASNLNGQALLEYLASSVSIESETAQGSVSIPPAIMQLCSPLNEDDDAARIYARAEQNLTNPQFSAADAVRISAAELLCGRSPKVVIFSGFVNGFIPSRDYFDTTVTPIDKQEKIHAIDTQRVYAATGKAKEDLVFTYFTKADLESAELLKLEIKRIKLEKGIRVCVIEPSEFLETILPNA